MHLPAHGARHGSPALLSLLGLLSRFAGSGCMNGQGRYGPAMLCISWHTVYPECRASLYIHGWRHQLSPMWISPKAGVSNLLTFLGCIARGRIVLVPIEKTLTRAHSHFEYFESQMAKKKKTCGAFCLYLQCNLELWVELWQFQIALQSR